MKTCFSCRHLYQCRLEYDRGYACSKYESNSKERTPAGSGTDEGEKSDAAGRQEKDGLTHVDGGHEERA